MPTPLQGLCCGSDLGDPGLQHRMLASYCLLSTVQPTLSAPTSLRKTKQEACGSCFHLSPGRGEGRTGWGIRVSPQFSCSGQVEGRKPHRGCAHARCSVLHGSQNTQHPVVFWQRGLHSQHSGNRPPSVVPVHDSVGGHICLQTEILRPLWSAGEALVTGVLLPPCPVASHPGCLVSAEPARVWARQGDSTATGPICNWQLPETPTGLLGPVPQLL